MTKSKTVLGMVFLNFEWFHEVKDINLKIENVVHNRTAHIRHMCKKTHTKRHRCLINAGIEKINI